jgi:hypothetical protein
MWKERGQYTFADPPLQYAFLHKGDKSCADFVSANFDEPGYENTHQHMRKQRYVACQLFCSF